MRESGKEKEDPKLATFLKPIAASAHKVQIQVVQDPRLNPGQRARQEPYDHGLELQRGTALRSLQNPLRRPTIIDMWSPYEIGLFESAICVYGKHFAAIAKTIKTKSCKEVVEFYYVWKKSSHYKIWKTRYADAWSGQ